MATRILPLGKITAFLGGPNVLMQEPRSDLDVIPLLREGLRYRTLEVLSCTIGISVNAAARHLRLPRRTLARRKEQHRLELLESERVFRLASIAARAVVMFSSAQHGRTWLLAENSALGGVAPITLLDTDVGASAAAEALRRIYPSDSSCL